MIGYNLRCKKEFIYSCEPSVCLFNAWFSLKIFHLVVLIFPLILHKEYISGLVRPYKTSLLDCGTKLFHEASSTFVGTEISGKAANDSFFRWNIIFKAGARLRGLENEFNKVCCYIDGWNLPTNCELKLTQVEQKDRMVLPGSHAQYRLKPSENYGLLVRFVLLFFSS